MSNKCKCNIISFGHVNLYILLILLGAFLKAIKEWVTSNYTNLRKGQANEPENQHPVIITLNYSMGLCLSFILYAIYKIYNRDKNKNKLFLDKMMNSQNKKITNKEKFFWILFGSPFDFFANLIYNYNWLKEEDYLCYWPTNMLLMSLFSFLILNMKLYKHHYLCILIIIIFGIVHNFISGHFGKEEMKKNYKGHLIYLLSESIFNVLYVLYKFFMIKKSIKSYGILCFQRLIEIIIGVIMLAITSKFCPELDNFETYFSNIEGREIAIFCTLIVINFITFLTIFIIIDMFTPFHIFLLNIISEIITGFFAQTYKAEIYKKVLYYIFIFIVIFIVLVFIEIIQLNFCGLSTMTKKNIEIRARLDSEMTNEDDDIIKADIKYRDTENINLEEYNVELQEYSTIYLDYHLIKLISIHFILNLIKHLLNRNRKK